ncbi:hypothetical protein Cs308_0191 [Candidatus Chlamydia sanziniae]|uniref:Uncharacterized protein n=1 Tax=Candidatus Chlamydia sanziniae TaxID=1806891 RepID=A0A1A9HW79_9CHLA|nr:hypothetical protein Cs308_0191 [Candidatus Chlamydia sanziniae]
MKKKSSNEEEILLLKKVILICELYAFFSKEKIFYALISLY